MYKILKIARTELQTLFYSPIAWLILVFFALQTGYIFTGSLEENLKHQLIGNPGGFYTFWLFKFEYMLGYLYIYIPLLTMGLISRELNTGSIKLLYSSPISNLQIILGKYFSMLIYGLVMTGIVALYVICGIISIEKVDVPVLLSALLGIYLLICAYSAIGLFMSCLTSYQVVAAVGTLALFGALNYVGQLWQGIAFVRDVTYWLSITTRANGFLVGFISSEDVLYFIIVVLMFLALSILKIDSGKNNKPFWTNTFRFAGTVFIAMFLGYLTSRPSLMAYVDTSRAKSNTLTPNSQKILQKLTGGLTITTYVNLFERNYYQGLPDFVNYDVENFKQYIRFKPDIKMKYVYYYHMSDNPPPMDLKANSEKELMEHICVVENLDPSIFLSPQEIGKIVNLEPEHYHFVRKLERDNGSSTFLRMFNDMQKQPSESEITAAFKRLVMKLPEVGFLTGHGERSIDDMGDRGYYSMTKNVSYRQALINQGFAVDTVNLAKNGEVPADINTLVIADMKTQLPPAQMSKLQNYIARGGNLFILGQNGRQSFMNPVVNPLGVKFMPGILVQQNDIYLPSLILANPTPAAIKFSFMFNENNDPRAKVTMPATNGLIYDQNHGFKITPLFVTDSTGSWSELQTTNFIDEKPALNISTGEKEMSVPTVIAMERHINNKNQKIIIAGNADCIANSELSTGRRKINPLNSDFIKGAFNWLSDGEVPIDIRRPRPLDNHIDLTLGEMSFIKMLFDWIIPGLLGICAIVIWVYRKNR